MIKLLLKAKHWQLFLIQVGLPFLSQLIFMAVIFTQIFNQSNGKPEVLPSGFVAILIPAFVSIVGLFGWMYAVGVGLQEKLPSSVPMRVVVFKFCTIFPLVYFLCFFIFFLNIWWMIDTQAEPPIFPFIMIIPLQLISIFCIGYSMWFMAKTLKSVELQREATLSEYAGDFALAWFYFIGVWILQPRINKIVAEGWEPESLNQ